MSCTSRPSAGRRVARSTTRVSDPTPSQAWDLNSEVPVTGLSAAQHSRFDSARGLGLQFDGGISAQRLISADRAPSMSPGTAPERCPYLERRTDFIRRSDISV